MGRLAGLTPAPRAILRIGVMRMPDREKVIKALENARRKGIDRSIVTHEALDSIIALLKAHWDDDVGHWIEGDRDGIDPHTRTTGEMIDTFRCSWCGFYQYWKTPFCPNCGAKMEGK